MSVTGEPKTEATPQSTTAANNAAKTSDRLLTGSTGADAIGQRNVEQTDAVLFPPEAPVLEEEAPRKEGQKKYKEINVRSTDKDKGATDLGSKLRGGQARLNQTSTLKFDLGGPTQYEVLKPLGGLAAGDVIRVASQEGPYYKAIRSSDGAKFDVPRDLETELQFREVKNYAAPTIGVEQEITGYKVDLSTGATAVIGVVQDKNNKKLVEFTKDMGEPTGNGRGRYRIELRTTPAEANDANAISERRKATAAIVAAIKQAAAHPDDTSVKTHDRDGFHIIIVNPDHNIWGVGAATFDNQVSLGVPTADLAAQALAPKTAENNAIIDHAEWFKASYADKFAPAKTTSPNAKNVYVMLASVIGFIVKTVKEAKPNAEAVEIDLTNPGIKDKWEVLPRTPPWEWLDCLGKDDKAEVHAQLQKTFADNLGKAALEYIETKKPLAGHPVPQATIDGKHSSIFEFRRVPKELDAYPYVEPVETPKPGATPPSWMAQRHAQMKPANKGEESDEESSDSE